MTKKRISALILSSFNMRVTAIFIVLCAVIMSIWLIVHLHEDQAVQTEKIHWIPIQPRIIEQQLGLVGRIRAARQMTLTAPFEGVVKEVMVREGEPVKSGQGILQLDPELLGIEMRQAQAELIKAQQVIHQLDMWNSSPDVSRARRNELSARSTLIVTQANLRDTEDLYKKGIVARMEVEALIQQERSQQQDLLNAQEELRDIKARGAGEDRKIAEMGLINAQVRYQVLEAQREKQMIIAPLDGIAVRPEDNLSGKSIFAQPGVKVSQGIPLMTIIGMRNLQVLTEVNESDLYLLHEGMPVKITGDGFIGQVLDGHIRSISAQSNSPDLSGSSARFEVVASIDALPAHSSQLIRLGMSARVNVILYENKDAIVVPPEAIHGEGESAWVWFQSSLHSDATKRQVVVGKAVAQGIEIKGIEGGYVGISGDTN